jgi:transcriptional regulator with XRE-family HTH domain
VHAPARTQVAERVRERRTTLKLTQDELALELGVTHQHVSRIEGGHAVPSLDLLVRLSSRLGVSTDYLLTGHQTTPLDITGAIRGDQHLNPATKRHLIGLVSELQGAQPAGSSAPRRGPR